MAIVGGLFGLVALSGGIDDSIYQGKEHTPTYNRGQNKDLVIYEGFQKNPIQPTERQRTILQLHGIDASGMKLKPAYEDEGKCSGGTTHFLNLVLNNASKKQLIDTFKNGVPLEAVVNHEIYLHIFELPAAPSIADSWEKGLNALSSFFSLSKTSQSQTQEPLKKHPSSDLQRHERVLLNLNNLEVEESIMDCQKSREMHFNSFEQEANYVVAHMPELAPGAYKLSVPNYGPVGELKAPHVIGFVKQEKTTLFYDANFTITEINNQDNQETLKRILRFYSGYSSTTSEKITNVWNGKPNTPAPWSPWESIELIKVNKLI